MKEKNFTFLISACIFPMAEICVKKLKNFYPESKVILSFDCEKFFSQKRVNFLKRNFHNIDVLENNFGIGHDRQLDRMVNFVNTDYFISFDDDTWMLSKGLIEYFSNKFESKDYFCVGDFNSTREHSTSEDRKFQSSPRFHVYATAYKTEVFKEKNMTFKRMKEHILLKNNYLKKEQPLFMDTGSCVYHDIFKYGLRSYDYRFDMDEIKKYIVHIGSVCHSFQDFLKEDIMKYTKELDRDNLNFISRKIIDVKKIEKHGDDHVKSMFVKILKYI